MRRAVTIGSLALLTATAVQAQQKHLGYVERSVTPKTAKFTVRIENVSTASTLKLSSGGTAPAPTAPLLWAVHSEIDPIFTDGARDRGQGLEALAEDGNPEVLEKSLRGRSGVAEVGTVNRPEGKLVPGPILPGDAYEFSFSAKAGQKLTVAMMFGQSNDLFYAPSGRGSTLFDASGKATSGDITSQFMLWDAGTEVNQEPGVGVDQAPRQKEANTGAAENGKVRLVRDQYRYPKTSGVIRVTVTAQSDQVSSK